MLPPRELKNKAFSKAVRGYNIAEVDEHIDFIIEKYTELYRANDELESKLNLALAQVEDYKKDENSIRTALIDAQKASAKIIAEANDRAEAVSRSAKENCDRVLSELKDEVRAEKDKLYRIQRMVSNFKNKIFLEYQAHIQSIERVAPEIDPDGQWNVPEEEYVRRAAESVKEDAAPKETEIPEDTEVSAEELFGFIKGSLNDEILTDESFKENDDPSEHSEDDASFETKLPSQEDLDEYNIFEEDNTVIFDDVGSPFETDDDPFETDDPFEVGGSEPDASSDTIVLERVPIAAKNTGGQDAGVKDTIIALNKMFASDNDSDDGIIIEDFSEIKDDADREFLNMLRQATENAGKLEEQRASKAKKRTKPMSFTDEFNLVYGSNKNKK